MNVPTSVSRNWKTKALGVAIFVGAIASAVVALLDGDAATNPDWQAILAAAAGIGIFVSRSESQHRKDAAPLLFAACLLPFLLMGCATPTASNLIDANQTVGKGSPSNLAVMEQSGRQVGSYQGGLPTNIKQDQEGAWITTPGQGGAVVLNLPNGISAYIWSPSDGSLETITVTPEPVSGEAMLTVTGLQFNVSEHAKVLAGMYADAMDALKDLTQTEATRRVAELKVAGEITQSVAQALLASFVPTLPVE